MRYNPPSMLHESFVTRYRVRDAATGQVLEDDILATLETQLSLARRNAEQISAVVVALSKDETQTPAARSLKARQIALARGESASLGLDQAKAKAVEGLARLEAEIAAPPEPANEIELQLESEARTRLAAMSDERRNAIISEAIKNGDGRTIGAILRGPAWLAGLSDTEQMTRRATWQSKQYPQETARVARLRKAIESTERAGNSLVAFVRDIAQDPAAILAEAAATATATAIAETEAA